MDEKGLLVRYCKLVEGLLTFWENFGDLIGPAYILMYG